ncbi:adenine deaminase [Anaerotaenia torta]|uniref:adenine deaminase n=1 Tax=Anaerotaenia torta TaxID=433293 RepID=UPI003D21848E
MHVKELAVARGLEKADLVLKNANIINVFTEEIEQGDVAICSGRIVGIGDYEGEQELDCAGQYVAPGFIDGHIHLESSMLKPVEFVKSVLPHGTTAVITDPHEIANVSGMEGIEYMLEASEGLPLDIYFVLPSCVPATAYDENGGVLLARDIEHLYQNKKVVGLAEVMDFYETIRGASDILKKIEDARAAGKIVDGHAPGIHGKDICAYVAAGVQSDHECISFEEAREKFLRGQWIMIREGTAARNLDALMGMFTPPYHQRAMLVTDDKHPYDILRLGHIDDIVRQAISKGADPCIAIKMGSFNAASYFGLKDYGAVAPGYHADLIVLSDLKEVRVRKVIKNGRVILDEQGAVPIREPEIRKELLDKVYHSFHCDEIVPEDFQVPYAEEEDAGQFRIIKMIEGEITTEEVFAPLQNGRAEVNLEEDIIKLAVIERHHNTNHVGLGFVTGYGLRRGAIASSVSHDSHNIIVIGTNDEDIATAANCIRDMQGGWAIVADGKVMGSLPLSIAGLMSNLDAVTLARDIENMQALARSMGVRDGIDPFMNMAFVSLPVIPKLRLTTTGLFDVTKQKMVPLAACRE